MTSIRLTALISALTKMVVIAGKVPAVKWANFSMSSNMAGDKENTQKIIELITAKIKGLESFDYIIPMPPSRDRPFQPVYELAEELRRRTGVRTGYALKKKQSHLEIKNIQNSQERKQALEQTLTLTGDYDLSGKKLLLLDDLYRSGLTLEIATNILRNQAKADKINVLTMTKTRSNR